MIAHWCEQLFNVFLWVLNLCKRTITCTERERERGGGGMAGYSEKPVMWRLLFFQRMIALRGRDSSSAD